MYQTGQIPGSPRGRMTTQFFVTKIKKGNEGKNERVSKQKLLKDCHQGKNVTVLVMFTVLLGCLEFKYFSLLNHPSTFRSISSALSNLVLMSTCLECLRASRANMPCVLMYSHGKLVWELKYSPANIPWVPCLTQLPWSPDYLLTCFTSPIKSFDATLFEVVHTVGKV